MNHQSFTPVRGIGGQKFLDANIPRGTLQVAHGVIRFHSDFVFCPQKPPKNTMAVAFVFWQKLKQLEFFNWYLDMNLPVQRNTDMYLVLELSSS